MCCVEWFAGTLNFGPCQNFRSENLLGRCLASFHALLTTSPHHIPRATKNFTRERTGNFSAVRWRNFCGPPGAAVKNFDTLERFRKANETAQQFIAFAGSVAIEIFHSKLHA
jgi:hypothetical protein